MATLTEAHHDWVKDTFNVDPRVYTPPDADIESGLDTLDSATIGKMVSVDVQQLYMDFSNTVHTLCKRAVDAKAAAIAVANVNWPLADAAGGAAILAKSHPTMSKEDHAILESDLLAIKSSTQILATLHDETESVVAEYKAAMDELMAMPRQVDDPPEDKPSKLAEYGEFLEHVWDFVNQVTQKADDVIQLMHFWAGIDFIKDAIKQDQTDAKIDAINTQLDAQRDAINTMIVVIKRRAKADADIAADKYAKKIQALKDRMALTREVIATYTGHLRDFSTPDKKGAKSALSPQAESVLRTYEAVMDAASASRLARGALNTKTLGPANYGTFANLMLPLGKPITDDAKTAGASLFLKNGKPYRYNATAAICESLASGLELVVAVHGDAAAIDALDTSWSAAMKSVR